MYAITDESYRAVSVGSPLWPGETLVESLPEALLTRVRRDKCRADRDRILRATDWTQMADAPLTPAKKLEWGVYRQLLRDLPGVVGFPNVPWPQPPANTDGAADGMPGASEPIPG
ncbi:tail fiber assembly protein [Stenotrophomonas indicatrix]|uniref:tail fiber assembly protein n=1 Tax=Stenotrophomonas indicatrix TaxID=2045451 RepID=UPI003CD026F9